MSSGAAGVKAGGAYVELLVKDSRFIKAINGARDRLKAISQSLMAAGKSVMLFTAPIVTGMGYALRQFMNTGAAIYEMSQKTGMAVPVLSELAYIAGQSGGSAEALGAALKRMTVILGEAQTEGSASAKALAAIGLSAKDLQGKTVADQFFAIVRGLDAIQDPALRAALATDIFGKSAIELRGMLDMTAEGLEKARVAAQKSGKTMSQEAAQAAAELQDTLNSLKGTLIGMVNTIVGELVPSVQALINWITPVAESIKKWMDENSALVATLLKIIAVAGAIAGALLLIKGIIVVAVTAWGVFLGILKIAAIILGALGAAFSLLLSPIGLVVAAVVGLIHWLFDLSKVAKAIFSWIASIVNKIAKKIAEFLKLSDEEMEAVNEEAEALKKEIEMKAKAPEPLKMDFESGIREAEKRTTAMGTFNPFAAYGFGVRTTMDKLIRANEETAANTRKIAERLQPGMAFQ